jgi:hypothetical protein
MFFCSAIALSSDTAIKFDCKDTSTSLALKDTAFNNLLILYTHYKKKKLNKLVKQLSESLNLLTILQKKTNNANYFLVHFLCLQAIDLYNKKVNLNEKEKVILTHDFRINVAQIAYLIA